MPIERDFRVRAKTRGILLSLVCVASTAWAVAQDAPQSRPAKADPRRPAATETKRGLILKTDGACAGYTLFAPLMSTTTYLIDLEGQLVHSWPSRYAPGQAVYLLDDGSLLRTEQQPGIRSFGGGGIGGRIERLAPDGTVLWEYVIVDEQRCQHHDIEPLPNGNVLVIAWEKKSSEEVLAAGRDPKQFRGDEMWPDCVLEVEPQGASGGKIVWEWHVWDHLVQDFDANKPNYGVVAEHPELVNLNFRRNAPRESSEEMARLRALGYVGGEEPEEERDDDGQPRFGPGLGGFDMGTDWCHTNAVAYNARLDQIALSVHSFNEIWIIDHGTSSAEAAGHERGRYGKGGDLLYRWGNPRAYGAGTAEDQTLFAQHDVRWIPDNLPGGGRLMAFNNGTGRSGTSYSSVVEIEPPIDGQGKYRLECGKAFEPARPSWEYTAENKRDFFSSHISGAQRLPNGDTLVCSGEQGRLFEVEPNGKLVWEYINPYIDVHMPFENSGPPGGGPGERGMRGQRPPNEEPAKGEPGDVKRDDGKDGRRPDRRRPGGPPGGGPWRPPRGSGGFPGGGPWGPPPGGGPGGGPGGSPGGGLFRAERLMLDHPGVLKLLENLRKD